MLWQLSYLTVFVWNYFIFRKWSRDKMSEMEPDENIEVYTVLWTVKLGVYWEETTIRKFTI